MDAAAPTPVSSASGEVIRLFRSLSERILEVADQGSPRDAFVGAVLRVLLDATRSDRASLRLPGIPGTTAWTLARGEDGTPTPWTLPEATPSVRESSVKGWRRRLPTGDTGSTQLGTVWTQREGLRGLADIEDGDRPRHLRNLACEPGTASVLLLPVVVGAADVGLLQLESSAEANFDAAHSRALEGAAQILGAALVTQRARWALQERVKELSCLYEIERLTHGAKEPLDDVLARVAAVLPPAWQHPDVAASRIVLDGRVFAGPGPRPWRAAQAAPIMVDGERRGLVEVGYSEDRPEFDEGPFLAEERSLLEAVAGEIASLIKRRAAAEERAHLEEQLQHADRLATIGQLAAGVAHELNEPLGAILGFTQLVRKERDLPPGTGEDLDRVVEAALHAREIVRKLMLFGRQSPPRIEAVDLARVIENGLYFLATRCAKSGIDLRREVGGESCIVRADAAQLYQVIVNLVVNAIQAMPQGGRLVVRVLQDGGDALLQVEDTGVGMTADVKERIFTPFFTTKDIGEGTGLGLSVVHGIVTSHRGSVEVDSAPGAGTRFTVRLPRDTTEAQRAP